MIAIAESAHFPHWEPLPTRYRRGTAHAQTALANIQGLSNTFQTPLPFESIRLGVAAADAPAHGMTFVDIAPTSLSAQDYRRAAEQIIAFGGLGNE